MSLPYDRQALRGRVAVVAGATRGAGRGIASALGEAGATVICTGRTSSVRRLKSDYDRAETIEETAELVTQLGGTGVAVPMDHLVPEEVQQLSERLQNEFGKIDILVNDIWGAEVLNGGPQSGTHLYGNSIWRRDSASCASQSILTSSRQSFCCLCSSLNPVDCLLKSLMGRQVQRFALPDSVYYDLAKVAVNRLAFSQGHELAPHGATAVAITPGWLRSEMMLENFGVTESNWRDALDAGRAETGQPVAPPDSRFPRRLATLVARLCRSHWIRTARVGISSQSAQVN